MLPRFLLVFVFRWRWVSRQELVAWHIRNFFRSHRREKLFLLSVFCFIATAKVSFFQEKYASRFRKKGKVKSMLSFVIISNDNELLLKEGKKSKTVFLYNRTIQLIHEKFLTLKKLVIHLSLTPFFLCFFFFFFESFFFFRFFFFFSSSLLSLSSEDEESSLLSSLPEDAGF